jgi:pyruvate/2-oxoglutarate dehydrogenase complex dihydrolipoamide dehydrogenase (E3) component
VIDVAMISAGPAGALAAIRAADLGARTALVSSAEFGGMAANDGPVPVRALAYAARLIRDARQLDCARIRERDPPYKIISPLAGSRRGGRIHSDRMATFC